MRIEILTERPEDLATALLEGKPTVYRYLKINRKEVQQLTIADLRDGYSVAWLNPKTGVRKVRYYSPRPVTQFTFNARKTKCDIRIIGKYLEEEL